MYMALKHTHLLLVVLSVALLFIRFVLAMRDSPLLQKKLFKVVPHVIDTFLLLSAAGLMLVLQQYPFVTPWLTEKFIGLLAYIALGVMALKGRTKALRLFAFLGALGWLALMVRVAVTKTPVLFG
jgi:uncharacterized membrane protein SirB2